MTSHNNAAAARYEQALAALPCPGHGFHAGLMRPANLGRSAGLSAAVVESDIERAARPGTRLIRPGEIREAVAKAFSGPQQPYAQGRERAGCARPPQRGAERIQQDSARLRAKFIADGGGQLTPEDVMAASPLPVADWPVHEHSWRLLDALYAPDDQLYIGGLDEGPSRQAKHVMPASEWAKRFRLLDGTTAAKPYTGTSMSIPPEEVKRLTALIFAKKEPGAAAPPPVEQNPLAWWRRALHNFIIPNPLTGREGQTKDGSPTMRGDACVARFPVCIAEFDSVTDPDGSTRIMPKGEQLAFWRGLQVPIVALVDTGGKSIHAWLAVRIAAAAEWAERVEGTLYREILVPLGVDSACRNESRFSRMPGVMRTETGRWQKLLWLCPRGEVLP